MSKPYIHRRVTPLELRDLVILARTEEAAFFARNPHLVAPYRGRLVATALCQGAALQFVGRGYGVGDFDVHFFYQQNPDKPRLSRTVKRATADVGNFKQVAVDFVRTVVPAAVCKWREGNPEDLVRAFLEAAPTANAYHLAKKAVVGLFPDRLFGRVLWP